MDNILIDKTIIGLKIAEDKQALLFETNAGNILVKTDGECCSYSWIEHIELPVNGFPAKVISVEDLTLESIQQTNRDVIAVYGCKVVTDKGEIIIDYRNESNGYYGGNLVWPGEHFYGGVYNQNISNELWTDIKEV